MLRLPLLTVSNRRDDFSGLSQNIGGLVSAGRWATGQKKCASAFDLKPMLGMGSYRMAWTWLHKLRRALVRPGRDNLSGVVEVATGDRFKNHLVPCVSTSKIKLQSMQLNVYPIMRL